MQRRDFLRNTAGLGAVLAAGFGREATAPDTQLELAGASSSASVPVAPPMRCVAASPLA